MANPGPPHPGASPAAGHGDKGEEQLIHHLENEKVPWSAGVWKAIHRTVHDETMRVRVGAKFLPHDRVTPETMSVQADRVTNAVLPGETLSTLTVDEGVTIRLNEIWTEFALTPQQVHQTAEAKNPERTTAVTLARRAAQYLALAQDIVIFQGFDGYSAPFFQQNVRTGGQKPTDGGLLSQNFTNQPSGAGPFVSPNAPIQVFPLSDGAPGVRYGENTFDKVTQGYAVLMSQGQPGPYALILDTVPYADLYAAVGSGSLVVTADRVQPLVQAGLFGTGTISPIALSSQPSSPPSSPSGPSYYGVLVSVGGNTMDLVVGQHATTIFMQQDINQLWRFRVLERFALRVIDSSAIQVLEFF